MSKTNTIAAIATATGSGAGHSGIGIVRISGDEAFQIIGKIFKPFREQKDILKVKSHTIHYGTIVDEDETIDEVLVMIMKAPSTYTAEDTAEINCHGGVFVVHRVLETVIKYGARPAEPGEFTKRAFLNGRIDLSQAEAVIDLIHAKNTLALNNSFKQLKGSVSDKVKEIREQVIYHIAFIEAALDDPEHIEMEHYRDELRPVASNIAEVLQKLLESFDNGKMITEGISTVILGKPNVGKSSLLNELAGEDRAIVSEIAGTTRDIIEEHIKIDGISLNIMDTAGIRDTEDVIEQIGVERAKRYADQADLIVFIADASMPLDENDRTILDMIQEKQSIVLVNKTDLEMVLDIKELKGLTDAPVLHLSIKEGIGMDLIADQIKNMFLQGKILYNDEMYITNMRHKNAISDAACSIRNVLDSIDRNMPEDFFSIDLMSTYESLGTIIGESVEDDLVNEIFSRFCMGK